MCEIHFSGFIVALDLKGILDMLKEVLRPIMPHNALTLQVSLSLRDR